MKSATLSALIACAALSVAGLAHADCKYPKAPDNVPDGKTATEQEMIDAMHAMKQYNTDMNAYLSCLDDETKAKVDAAGPNAPADQITQIKSIANQRHDAAVEELQAHAANFNEQVRAYKSKGKS